MKAPFSPYLDSIAPALKLAVKKLGACCDYVSALSTDSVGVRLGISRRSKTVSNTNMTTERGTVIRVAKDGLYSEFAFNEFDPSDPDGAVASLKERVDAQLALVRELGVKPYETGILSDEPLELFVEKEAEILPENADLGGLVEKFTALSEKGIATVEGALDCGVSGTSTHVSKMFITENRFLRQSYVYTEGSYMAYAPDKNGEMKVIYEGVSGCGGLEVLDGISDILDKAPGLMRDMLSSEKIVPGEYEIITDPGVSGLIAHEAFGHGVEMDMFVKNRALGAKYIDKRVGSDAVTMHEGAKCAESVTAYAFDDEGVLAGDVVEIDHGVLKTGICDALSALRLGVAPTGNGKRERYSHKVYTRMTNTLFEPGDADLEEMIASVSDGFLLRGSESGMEDPKHWGIQCIVSRGYEIKNGKLTGRVVSPIVMTGYVPDLLNNVSMASRESGVFGNGACGKGHKEWVKVADGGPYLKTKARLG